MTRSLFLQSFFFSFSFSFLSLYTFLHIPRFFFFYPFVFLLPRVYRGLHTKETTKHSFSAYFFTLLTFFSFFFFVNGWWISFCDLYFGEQWRLYRRPLFSYSQ
ncbi:hypothetical protein DFP73DRAFT_555816 [Morchella snyderi]|nr:hypothetical protein DFP73DRAFT_555816 [Morchella snyderi]